ncbi:MAG: membrane protein insertase YidC [Bacteroidaceae bacterium]
MDKNTITGFVLMALVLIGFSYFSQPNEQEKAKMHQQDSIMLAQAQQQQIIKEAENLKIKKPVIDSIATDTTSLFGEAKKGEAKDIILQNKEVKIAISTKGGCIANVSLKNYKNQQKQPVNLYSNKNAKMDFIFAGREENIRTSQYYFTPTNVTDSTVTMQLTAKNGGVISLDYKLLGEHYMVNFAIATKGLENQFAASAKNIAIEWTDSTQQQEKGYKFENQYATLTYKKKDNGTDYLSAATDEEKDVAERLDWVAFKNQFFSCVLISNEDFSNAKLSSSPLPENSGYLKYYKASMQTSLDPTGAKATTMQMYFGPNKYRLLQSMNELSPVQKDLNLEELVYLGWPLFRYINRFFTIYVFDWLTQFGLSMGVVLLIITLLLKVIVYPTTRKSYISSAKMRVLKPKIDEIAKKYPNKEDAMKKQQETMALYSKYGASPMGGCLPMMLQMPIWIAMFNFVPNAIELRQQSFLWADDLSTYDDVISWGTHIWLIGDHLSLFCLLFCVTNLIYSWMMMQQQQSSMVAEQASQMKMMQYMMLAMPVFFFFIFNDYSAGLNYYYFISLLFSALTMWYLKRTTDDKLLLAKMEEFYDKNKDNPKKASGMMARFEAMQKKADEQKKNQKR